MNEVYIIDDDESSIVVFRELFRDDKEYKFISVKTEQIDIALKNIPSLIVINEDAIDRDVIEICRKIIFKDFCSGCNDCNFCSLQRRMVHFKQTIKAVISRKYSRFALKPQKIYTVKHDDV